MYRLHSFSHIAKSQSGIMLSSAITLGCLAVAGLVSAQSASTTGTGYTGYNLTLEGDEGSAIFSSEETRPDAGVNYPDPDVFLNASLVCLQRSIIVLSERRSDERHKLTRRCCSSSARLILKWYVDLRAILCIAGRVANMRGTGKHHGKGTISTRYV